MLEVLTYNEQNEDFTLYSPEFRFYHEKADLILRKVVADMSKDVASEAISGIVNEYASESLRKLIVP